MPSVYWNHVLIEVVRTVVYFFLDFIGNELLLNFNSYIVA